MKPPSSSKPPPPEQPAEAQEPAVDEQATSTPTIPGAPAITTPEPGATSFRLTLADVGAAAVVLLITLFIFQHFPAFLEIALLQRLPLDSGSRYALSTILRYIIASIGLLIAFGAVGLSWSQVQWLAAGAHVRPSPSGFRRSSPTSSRGSSCSSSARFESATR